MKSSDFYCKRHILAWKHVVWAILRECPLRGQKVSNSHRNEVSPLTQGLCYRVACDILEIFAYDRGFSVSAIEWHQTSSIATIPFAMATKFGAKLAISPLVYEITCRCLHPTGVIGVGLLNDASQILPRPSPIATATKFEKNGYNSACIRDISEILASNRGFLGLSYPMMWEILKGPTQVAMATKFETKSICHNSACIRDI